jgi:D-3-phosphoglycerate dehydrogenase
VIGAGNIGSIVCDRARGLEMKVVAFDPFLGQEKADQMGVEKVGARRAPRARDFHHAARAADGAQTRNILSREAIGAAQARRADRQLRARRASWTRRRWRRP